MPRQYKKRETVDLKLRVAPEVHDAIQERSALENRSINAIGERILRQAVNRWATAKEKAQA